MTAEIHVLLFPGFNRQGSHSFVGKSAGIDHLKKTQIRIDVQGKTMHGHIMAALDTHGSNFTGFAWNININPDTCCTFQPFTFDIEFLQKKNDGFFNVKKKLTEANIEMIQVKDGITYNLTCLLYTSDAADE